MKFYLFAAALNGLLVLSLAGHVDTMHLLLPDSLRDDNNMTTMEPNITTPVTNETTTLPTTTQVISSTTSEPTVTLIYVLTDDATNITCLMLQGNITVTFNYVNASKENHSMNVTVPRDAIVAGSCGSNTDMLILTWRNAFAVNNSLSLNFTKDGGHYSLTYVYFSVSVLSFSVIKNGTVSPSNSLETTVGTSYKCANSVTVKFNDSSLTINDLLVDAFMTSKEDKPKFEKTGSDCSYNGKTDAIVPIAVGIALAVMVIIVLIGYFIGRRRTAAAGYQSMTNA
ncbi:LAMP family protein lmp-1-like [Watersipora subatra]|uniref:LAMP family protein lmp-1-like n=1 Tax=Watersipora subatra TaxID=2589382 RepID=UPI00355AE9A9